MKQSHEFKLWSPQSMFFYIFKVSELLSCTKFSQWRLTYEIIPLVCWGISPVLRKTYRSSFKEFDLVLNWNWVVLCRYDPVHWGVPEGSYASDPNGPARTLECRTMVQVSFNLPELVKGSRLYLRRNTNFSLHYIGLPLPSRIMTFQFMQV